MGKFSLDAFEAHPLTKLRPGMKAPEQSCFRLLELSQSELEPEPGTLLPPPETGPGQVILRLHLDGRRDIPDACGFVRRMGSCYAGGKRLAGVVMTSGGCRGTDLAQLVQAYRQGFEETWLLAEPGTELMELCQKAGVPVGLWLPVSKGILNLRRSIAGANLERTWRERPVYLYAGRTLTPQELDAAGRWHASGCDQPAPLGPRMTLRRLMFPRELNSGGVMPLRMWWQNVGTAPVYQDVRVRLMLRRGQESDPVCVPGTLRPGMGDTTFNVTARLPDVGCGTCELWVGLEAEGRNLPLAMEAPEENGLYCLGEIRLDDVDRPYLKTMWEIQYADGYYPLEDPAQPE